MLRQPTLADVKAIARLVNDRRVAENRVASPHPYTRDDAVDFITATAAADRDTVFLIEHNRTPIGMVGIDWQNPDLPELGYWLGVEYWGRGFGHRGSARRDRPPRSRSYAIERLVSGARVSNPASRHILEKCGFQWTGVELHRFLALGSSTPVDRFRLDRSVGFAEELGDEYEKVSVVAEAHRSMCADAPRHFQPSCGRCWPQRLCTLCRHARPLGRVSTTSLQRRRQGVDTRAKRGHDGGGWREALRPSKSPYDAIISNRSIPIRIVGRDHPHLACARPVLDGVLPRSMAVRISSNCSK